MSAPLPVSLPNDTQRIAIIGRTGSGKTQAAIWHLSLRSFDKMPWIVFDFKGDKLISELPQTQVVDIRKPPPMQPGVYIVRPLPHEAEEVEAFLWKVWGNENTGVYFDEGYMVSGSKAFQALLTQGRSKHIPIIVLTQRPVWISRFVWSESDFYQVFALTDIDDQKSVKRFVRRMPLDYEPEPYHSLYHDVGRNVTISLGPVPDRDSLLRTFRSRMPRRVGFL